ncbi:MAG: aspartate kinase [Clostridia bacterium]|jgi:aspartate kinase|nr:aspartate kinase [Clostridia bacterium]
MKNILVQKFGGTSVATAEIRKQVIQKIVNAKKAGYEVVVVVSAMGRKGAPYATDTLIQLAKESGNTVSAREMDLLMSCGEIISGVVLATTLQNMGYEAVFLTGAQAGIITNNEFGNACISRVEPDRVKEYLEKKQIVIVAGFQGISEDGEITTLGRGGSDTTATALGVALNAEAVEIYTDVDGVKTADPKIVGDAKTLENVTYNEVCQLAYEGAKVVHPRAVEIAMKYNIPLRVKSTFTDDPGTLVSNTKSDALELNERLITGITQIPNLTQLRIDTSRTEDNKIHLRIFKAMALAKISVDFINVFTDEVIFCVKDEVTEDAIKILENMKLEVKENRGCAKIAAVGAGMTGIPGVMARIVEALTDAGIEILQSADSYTSIWCLVKKEKMEDAVKALHHQFNLNK